MSTYSPTTAVKNSELDSMFQSRFISLHTDPPGGTGANEVTGGSYARQAENFGAASSGALTNAADITYLNMPACTVKYVGFWTLVSGGTFLGSLPLDTNIDVLATQTFLFEAGDLDLSMAG